MADDMEELDSYRSSLQDLTFNSKPLINMLTMLAEDHEQLATDIVQIIEQHIEQVKTSHKLPVMYLIDSIVKNLPSTLYPKLLSQNIVQIFCGVFEEELVDEFIGKIDENVHKKLKTQMVDEKTRQSLFKLRQTWKDIFPNKKLYGIDVRVNMMDPAWPITAQPPEQGNIHVNPKFLVQSAEEKARFSPPAPSPPPDDTEELMRQQLQAKEQELQKLKLELELAETRAKLEQQKKELEEKHRAEQEHLKSLHTAPEVQPSAKAGSNAPRDPRLVSRDPRKSNRDPRLSQSQPVASTSGNLAVLQNTNVVAALSNVLLGPHTGESPLSDSDSVVTLPVPAPKEKQEKSKHEKKESPPSKKSPPEKKGKSELSDSRKGDRKDRSDKKEIVSSKSPKKDAGRNSKEKQKDSLKDMKKKSSKSDLRDTKSRDSQDSRKSRSVSPRDRKDRKGSKEKDTKQKSRDKNDRGSSDEEYAKFKRQSRRDEDVTEENFWRSNRGNRTFRSRNGDRNEGPRGRRGSKDDYERSSRRSRSPPRREKDRNQSNQKPIKKFDVKKDPREHHMRTLPDLPLPSAMPLDQILPKDFDVQQPKKPRTLTVKRESAEMDIDERSLDFDGVSHVGPPESKRPRIDASAESNLFGGEDIDYRYSSSTPMKSPMHDGWMKYKTSHPSEYADELERRKSRDETPLEDVDFRKIQSPPMKMRPPPFPPLQLTTNISIPQELQLDRQKEILLQAEKQVQAGSLTHEQHMELLKQLGQVFDMQRNRQKQSTRIDPRVAAREARQKEAQAMDVTVVKQEDVDQRKQASEAEKQLMDINRRLGGLPDFVRKRQPQSDVDIRKKLLADLDIRRKHLVDIDSRKPVPTDVDTRQQGLVDVDIRQKPPSRDPRKRLPMDVEKKASDAEKPVKKFDVHKQPPEDVDIRRNPPADMDIRQAQTSDGDRRQMPGQLVDIDNRRKQTDEAQKKMLSDVDARYQPLIDVDARQQKTQLADVDARQQQQPIADVDAREERLADVDVRKQPLADIDVRKQPIMDVDVRKQSKPDVDSRKQPVADVDARKQPVADVDARKQPVADVDARKQPIADVDARKQPVADVDVRIQPVADVDARKQPVADVDARKQPVADVDARKQPVADVDARKQPVADVDARKQPVADVDARKQPVADVDARKQPVADVDARIQPIADVDARIQPIADVDARQPVEDVDARKQPKTDVDARQQQHVVDTDVHQKPVSDVNARHPSISDVDARQEVADVDIRKQRKTPVDIDARQHTKMDVDNRKPSGAQIDVKNMPKDTQKQPLLPTPKHTEMHSSQKHQVDAEKRQQPPSDADEVKPPADVDVRRTNVELVQNSLKDVGNKQNKNNSDTKEVVSDQQTPLVGNNVKLSVKELQENSSSDVDRPKQLDTNTNNLKKFQGDVVDHQKSGDSVETPPNALADVDIRQHPPRDSDSGLPPMDLDMRHPPILDSPTKRGNRPKDFNEHIMPRLDDQRPDVRPMDVDVRPRRQSPPHLAPEDSDLRHGLPPGDFGDQDLRQRPPQDFSLRGMPQDIDHRGPPRNFDPRGTPQNIDPRGPPRDYEPCMPPRDFDPRGPRDYDHHGPHRDFDPRDRHQNFDPRDRRQTFDLRDRPKDFDTRAHHLDFDPRDRRQDFDPRGHPRSQARDYDPRGPPREYDLHDQPRNFDRRGPRPDYDAHGLEENFGHRVPAEDFDYRGPPRSRDRPEPRHDMPPPRDFDPRDRLRHPDIDHRGSKPEFDHRGSRQRPDFEDRDRFGGRRHGDRSGRYPRRDERDDHFRDEKFLNRRDRPGKGQRRHEGYEDSRWKAMQGFHQTEAKEEFVIDGIAYEMKIGSRPRKIKIKGLVLEVIADPNQRGIVINGKLLYKFGEPIKRVAIDGRTFTVYFHGLRKAIWIDGSQHELRIDAPPRNIVLDGKMRGFQIDGRDMMILVDRIEKGTYGGPPRQLLIENIIHEIRFEAPPRQILIDGQSCDLILDRAVPVVIYNGKPHGIRFDGPPREMIIDDFKFVVPMDDAAKVRIKHKPHILAFGGPAHEVIIDGKRYEIKFDSIPREIVIGHNHHTIRLEGPTPNVKIMDEVPIEYENAMFKSFGMQPAVPQQPVNMGVPGPVNPGQPMGPVPVGARPIMQPQPVMQQPGIGQPMGTMQGGMMMQGGPVMMQNQMMGNMQPMMGGMPMQQGQMLMGGMQQGQMFMQPAVPVSQGVGLPNVLSNLLPVAGGLQTPAAPTPVLDVSSLFQKLVNAGIIPKGEKTEEKSKETSSEKELARPKEDKRDHKTKTAFTQEKEKYSKVPEFTLDKTDQMKEFYRGVIVGIYEGIQCSSCGTRFRMEDTNIYREHLDWHFRQNKRGKDDTKVARNRNWYYKITDWIQFEEFGDAEEKGHSQVFEKMLQGPQATEATGPTLPVPPSTSGVSCPAATGNEQDDRCCICHDPFEQYWNEEAEDWHLRDAIRIENKTYHPVCYEDAREEGTILEPSPTPTSATKVNPLVEQIQQTLKSEPNQPPPTVTSPKPIPVTMPVSNLTSTVVTVKTEPVSTEISVTPVTTASSQPVKQETAEKKEDLSMSGTPDVKGDKS